MTNLGKSDRRVSLLIEAVVLVSYLDCRSTLWTLNLVQLCGSRVLVYDVVYEPEDLVFSPEE